MIHPCQYGFVKGKSCTTHFIQVHDDIGKSLDNGSQTDIIYLDFAKAFASVNHDLLIHKCTSYGIGGNLLCWFKAYLHGSYQRVVLECSYSDWVPVDSGEQQGSILGPLLYLYQ